MGLHRRRLQTNSSKSFDKHQHVVRDRRSIEPRCALAYYLGNRRRVGAPKLALKSFNDQPQSCLEIQVANTVLHGLRPLTQEASLVVPARIKTDTQLQDSTQQRRVQKSMRASVTAAGPKNNDQEACVVCALHTSTELFPS